MTDTKTGISSCVVARSSCVTTHDHQVFFHSHEALPAAPPLGVPHFAFEKQTNKKTNSSLITVVSKDNSTTADWVRVLLYGKLS